MPKAYIIATVTIDNPEGYKEYASQTPALIAQYGGRIIVRGGDPDTMEGMPLGSRVVVIEFDSRQAAQAYYNSPEYQKIIPIRQANSTASMIVVDGAD